MRSVERISHSAESPVKSNANSAPFIISIVSKFVDIDPCDEREISEWNGRLLRCAGHFRPHWGARASALIVIFCGTRREVSAFDRFRADVGLQSSTNARNRLPDRN